MSKIINMGMVKITAWGHTPDGVAARVDHALREFRVRCVSSNLQFQENVFVHPLFRSGESNTCIIDTTPELFDFQKRRGDSRMLKFLGKLGINGNPKMKDRTVSHLRWQLR